MQTNGVDSQQTLNQWLDTWLKVYKMPTVKQKTAAMYLWSVSAISAHPCSQMAVMDVTELNLQQLLNTAADNGYSKSSIIKLRTTLRQAYRPLIRQSIVAMDPTVNLIVPLSPTKEVLPLTRRQQDAVELACRSDALGHLLIFLMETGLRKGELMGLRWEHYNPADPSIFVEASKTPAGVRKVYLTKRANAIVQQQAHINDYIFNHTRCAPITQTVMRRLVERIRRVTNIKALACHVCRHTFVTRLCEKRVPVKAIAQIIGHAKVDYVLDIYAQMEADELRKAIYALEPDGCSTAIMGAELRIPVDLYKQLQATATEQGTSVDALVTHLLTLYVSGSSKN